MKGTTALTKIRVRTKSILKAHPGKSYRAAQKQAASEYRSGTIPKARKKKAAPKKRKRSKVSGTSIGAKYKVYHEVKRVGKAKRKRSRSTAKPKVVTRTRTRTVTKYRRVGGTGMSKTTKTLLIAGAVAVGAYLLLKKPAPVTVPGVPVPLAQTGNAARDTSAQNLLAYAQAAGAGVTALTALINSLNSMNDAAVVSANQQVSVGANINTLLALPTGGPSINLG